MIFSLYYYIWTTIALIGVCALGVTGVIDDLTVYKDSILVRPQFHSAFAIGGFIISSYDRDDVTAHEYGHLQQEKQYGILYAPLVAIPSILNYLGIYDARGIESDATRRGEL